MIQGLRTVIDKYKSDEESVFINNEERLKAFRSIRRGVQNVIKDIKESRFGNDYKGSSLEFVLTCITEQNSFLETRRHSF